MCLLRSSGVWIASGAVVWSRIGVRVRLCGLGPGTLLSGSLCVLFVI